MRSFTTTQRLIYTLLIVISAGVFYVSPAHAETWTVVDLNMNVRNTATGFASSTIYYPSDIVGHGYWVEYYMKTLPADNNYYNSAVTGDQCYPQNGGTASFTATSSLDLRANYHQTSNTSFSSPACNVSGNYYAIFRDSTASSTILYVATYSYDVTTNTFSSPNNVTQTECTTCTRVISTDPAQETVATTTSRDYFIDYYVSSEDYISGDTLIEMTYRHALSEPTLPSGYNIFTETFRASAFNSGYNSAIFNLANTYVAGTYNVTIKIYTEVTIEQPWYNFWDDDETIRTDLVTYNTYFHAGQYSTIDEIEANRNALTETSYFSNFADANSLKTFLDGYIDTIMHGAPIGYATRIFEILSATTTSTSGLAITLDFPSTSPAYGKGITLDLQEGSNFAIAYIGQETYDDLMYYWNFIWYTLLFFWILKEVFGTFNISIEKETVEQKPTNYQKRGHISGVNPVSKGRGTYMNRKQFKP